MLNTINMPNMAKMTDDEVKNWVQTLTTPDVYANLKQLTEAVIHRFGPSARVATFTYHPPKVVFLMEDEV